MYPLDANNPELGRAHVDELRGALRLLFASLSTKDRESAVGAYLAEQDNSPDALRGLFVARKQGKLCGSILAKMNPGGTAVVWPPRLAENSCETFADQLLAQVDGLLANEPIVMAQALTHENTPEDVPRLIRAGYQHLTDLDYLVCGLTNIAPRQNEAELQFESFSDAKAERMARLIHDTYEDTQDCPQLNDVRSMNDVLAGHRATGEFQPHHWNFVRRGNTDVGCLLLARHPGTETWELVYMGITPAARGQDHGLRIVRHAQHTAATAGATTMVLAMDTRNNPARAMYERAGFAGWDTRAVYWKRFPTN